MPSQRKRIGFLPTSEVQEIINNICTSEKISQSKVTGILVSEALNARLKKSTNNNTNEIKDSSSDRELSMIKEFLEYKEFKKLMMKAKSGNTS